jgi:hypothetical protein
MDRVVIVVWERLHAQRLALNMFSCAFFLWPWGSLPRETISGFFGRKAQCGSPVARFVARCIDAMHPLEPNHCAATAQMEYDARVCLMYHL